MRNTHFDLERFIHPLGTDEFIQTYWEKKPFVFHRGDPEYYADLFSADDIDTIVRFRQLEYLQLRIARTDKETQTRRNFSVADEELSNINRLYNAYNLGDTIVFNSAKSYWEPAARLCTELERFFSFPVGINIYVTPPGAQGYPPHYDPHDVFVAQIEGAKTWRIYDSWVDLPYERLADKPIPLEMPNDPEQEFTLNAGDILYIPRGYVHEPFTTDRPSIHFTVGIRPYYWKDLLADLLTLESEHDVELRRALPIGYLNNDDAARTLEQRVPELVHNLAKSDKLKVCIARLQERFIDRMQPLPDGHFRSLAKAAQMNPDTMVARRKGLICHVTGNEDSSQIIFPGNRIKGPVAVEAAWRFIADSDAAFPVSALPGNLSASSKVLLARRAVKEGLLTIVDQESS